MEGIFLLALCNSAAMGALQHNNVSMGKVGLWMKNYIKRHRQLNSDLTIESSILQGTAILKDITRNTPSLIFAIPMTFRGDLRKLKFRKIHLTECSSARGCNCYRD